MRGPGPCTPAAPSVVHSQDPTGHGQPRGPRLSSTNAGEMGLQPQHGLRARSLRPPSGGDSVHHLCKPRPRFTLANPAPCKLSPAEGLPGDARAPPEAEAR